MKRLTGLMSLMLVAMLFLSACGGTASASSNTNANNSGVTLNVTMSDFKFDPSSWIVPAGKTITVNLNNTGSAPHTWTVMSKPISGSYTSADQSDILFNSGRVLPGASKTINFTTPITPGNYQVICIQSGHFEAGMVGQLTVK